MTSKSTAVYSLILFFASCAPIFAQTEIELLPQGIVPPRTTQTRVTNPIEGQIIYDTDHNGLTYFDRTVWVVLDTKPETKTLTLNAGDLNLSPSQSIGEFGIFASQEGLLTSLSIKHPTDWDGSSDVIVDLYLVPGTFAGAIGAFTISLSAKSLNVGDSFSYFHLAK